MLPQLAPLCVFWVLKLHSVVCTASILPTEPSSRSLSAHFRVLCLQGPEFLFLLLNGSPSHHMQMSLQREAFLLPQVPLTVTGLPSSPALLPVRSFMFLCSACKHWSHGPFLTRAPSWTPPPPHVLTVLQDTIRDSGEKLEGQALSLTSFSPSTQLTE